MGNRRWLGLLVAVVCACGSASDDGDGEASAESVTTTKISLAVGIERKRAATADPKDDAAVQRASLHLGNAYWMALLANASYAATEDAVRANVTSLGVPANDVRVFLNTCTRAVAYFATVGDAQVLAFRGTEPNEIETLLADADSLKIRWREGYVHEGFLAQFASVWLAMPGCGVPEGIGSYVAARRKNNLYVTGHSLGAALATLALRELQVDDRKPPVSALYTFGSPKTGDTMFAEAVAFAARGKTSIFRFVYADDPVTVIPRNLVLADMIHYMHVSYGDTEDTFQVWFDKQDIEVSSFVLRAAVIPDDHMPVHYPAGIAVHAKKRGELK
jgi:hypothetical protein